MAPPVRGFGGTLGIAEESTWGTEVARSNWKEMVSLGLRRTLTNKPVPELGRLGQVSTNHRFNYIESDFSGGPMSFIACYDDSTVMLMKHLLGAVATTGANPYVHDVTLASPVPTGLTLEAINGTGNGTLTSMAEVFEGCKLASGRLYITAGGLLMVDVEVIGQTSSGLEAAGTPTYTSGGERIRHNQAGVVQFGGTTVAINSMAISIERGLERNQEVGSANTSEPVESQLDVTVELRTKWQADTFDSAYLSRTQGDLTVTFTGSGGGGNNRLVITGHNMQIDDVAREVSSAGAIEQVIKGRLYSESNSGDQGLSLAFRNTNALATAN